MCFGEEYFIEGGFSLLLFNNEYYIECEDVYVYFCIEFSNNIFFYFVYSILFCSFLVMVYILYLLYFILFFV